MTQTPENPTHIDRRAQEAPRTNHTEELYRAAFGENLKGAQTIADIGAGKSDFALHAPEGKRIVRVDAQYDTHPPEGEDYIAARAQDMSIIPDESFDATVSVLMMQHIPHGNGDVAQAISEMVRITKPYNPDNPDAGKVSIYPVWNKKAMEKALRPFADVAHVGYASFDEMENMTAEYINPTLMIARTEALTPGRLHDLANAIEASKAFKRPPSLGQVVRRLVIRKTGKTERDTSKKHDVHLALH